MKAKLIKKITGIYKLELDDKVIASDDVDMQKDLEIGKLSKQNCDEIFRVTDVEKLAEEKYPNDGYADTILMQKGFIKGFKKAMELNKDKLFTEEDVRKAYIYGVSNCHSFGHSAIDYTDKCIQSLQQPTEIEVEILMQCIDPNCDSLNRKGCCIPSNKPKLDENGCMILKKVIS
jgi:hypothetical protein